MIEKLQKFFHLYDEKLTEIFIERNQFNYRKKHLLIIALFTFTVARILICLISYYCHINIWQYDPLFNFFIFDHPHLFQRYSIILLCALLFGMECERKIFFTLFVLGKSCCFTPTTIVINEIQTIKKI